jgi:hypothetical protein
MQPSLPISLLCASAPLRESSPSGAGGLARRRRGAVAISNWPWGWVWAHALIQAFLGLLGYSFSADQGDWGKSPRHACNPLSPPPSSAPQRLCASPPHPGSGCSRRGAGVIFNRSVTAGLPVHELQSSPLPFAESSGSCWDAGRVRVRPTHTPVPRASPHSARSRQSETAPR